MTVARIVEEQRKTTQSGKAKVGRWTLEYERKEALRPDPLTGWAGSGDTETQLRLGFDSKDEALAMRGRKGLRCTSSPPRRSGSSCRPTPTISAEFQSAKHAVVALPQAMPIGLPPD